jgi:hypothetical protein
MTWRYAETDEVAKRRAQRKRRHHPSDRNDSHGGGEETLLRANATRADRPSRAVEADLIEETSLQRSTAFRAQLAQRRKLGLGCHGFSHLLDGSGSR